MRKKELKHKGREQKPKQTKQQRYFHSRDCLMSMAGMPGGGGTPICGLYRYVPPGRAGFLRFIFAPFGNVFPV